MMDRTDRHFRVLMRLISRHTLLYTEMITAAAILYGDRDRLLHYFPEEHPIALQLGGDDPAMMAQCARLAEEWGYDEVNINVGCPSSRVKKGCFGASLMARPERVAELVAEMRAVTTIPVTVKHRIGIDDLDRYEDMANFVEVVSQSDADRFTVHARKAWLQGLSPKENRNIPPLRYAEVHRLQEAFPNLVVEINGGVRSLDAVEEQLAHVPAVMLGRAAYDDPYMFADVDRRFFGDSAPPLSRAEVVERMVAHAERWCSQGGQVKKVTRHMLNFFHGVPGTKAWKRYLNAHSFKTDASPEVISRAFEEVCRRSGPLVERGQGATSSASA